MAENEIVEVGFEEFEIQNNPLTVNPDTSDRNDPSHYQIITPGDSLFEYCFSCLDEAGPRSRFLSIKNKRCKEDNLYFKLKTFLGDGKLVDQLFQFKEASICRSCCRKVNFVHSFRENLEIGIISYLASRKNAHHQNATGSQMAKKQKTVRNRDDILANYSSQCVASESYLPVSVPSDSIISTSYLEETNEDDVNEELSHELPSDDHCYTTASLKKRSTVVYVDTESMESYSEEGTEDQSGLDQTGREVKTSFVSNKLLLQNKTPTSISALSNITGVLQTNPVIQAKHNAEDIKKDGQKMITIPATLHFVKHGQNQATTSVLSDGKKLKKPKSKIEYRHSDCVKSFGTVTLVEKGSHTVDITKKRTPAIIPSNGYFYSPGKVTMKPAPRQPTVREALAARAQLQGQQGPAGHNFAVDESSDSADKQKKQLDVFSEDIFYSTLQIAVQSRNFQEIFNILSSHSAFAERVKSLFIQTVQLECQELSVTKPLLGREQPCSILRKINNLTVLTEYEDYVAEIFKEMKSRCPCLLEVMVTVTGSHPTNLPLENIAPITSAYAILMKFRQAALTGWHKLVNCVLEHGNIEERMMVVLNHMGLVQCGSSRARLMEKVVDDKEDNLAKIVKQHPLAKITCDIDVRSSGSSLSENDSSEIQVLAASLILVKEIGSSLDNTPQPFPEKIPSTTFLPTTQSLETLQSVYAVLVGRIIKELPGLSWITVPDHIPHSRSAIAAQKTEIHSLPMTFCYQTKRNEGVKVLHYLHDVLQQLYNKGNDSGVETDRPPVPIGANQLSRAQLEFARRRKMGKASQKERFKHLGPFVTEFWHNKKDFVAKAYQVLFNKKSLNQEGTLYYYKSKLQLAFVTGNLEKNYEAHYDLLVTMGRYLIQEQAMEFFSIDTETGTATRNVPKNVENMSHEEKLVVSKEALKKFIEYFGYASLFFSEHKLPTKTYEVQEVLPGGKRVLLEVPEDELEADEVYNYCMQLTHWALHLLEMEDTAREGDSERLVLDTQYSLPYFFSFSPFSNQLIENIDFLVKIKHTLSPLMRELILRTAFVNLEGGKGNCCEADHAHEQNVRNQKSLVRHLDTIATDKMVRQSSGAADVVCKIADNAAHSLQIVKKKVKASKYLTDGQKQAIKTMLRSLRPFRKIPGRTCKGFRNIEAYPFKEASRTEMLKRLDCIVGRLRCGEGLDIEEEEDFDTDTEQTPEETPVKRKRSRKQENKSGKSKKPNEALSGMNPEGDSVAPKPEESMDTLMDFSEMLDLLGPK